MIERGDAQELLASIGRWAGELEERGLAGAHAEALRRLLDQSRAERLDAPADPLLVVMLCGPTAVGKSSLINALAGAEISRAGLGAATRDPVLYVHELDDPARLFEYSQTLGEMGRAPASVVRHAREALRHKVLVDTPDIDSVMLEHRERTAKLVHAADLVLFVMSPEKYKVLRAARWVEEQSRARALAFVLNKWDRATLGVQHERRAELEADVRAELVRAGFEAPVLFRTSSVPDVADGGLENDLPALRRWLEAGLDRSISAAIQSRRQIAARGRLAAGLDEAIPKPLSREPIIADALRELADWRVPAGELVAAQALNLPVSDMQVAAKPATPGLFGGWLLLSGRLAEWRSHYVATSTAPVSAQGFGEPAVRQMQQVTRRVGARAELARIPLGPVPETWDDIADALREDLATVPERAGAEIAARASKRSLRRMGGIGAHLLIEAAILAVLGVALWRLALDFLSGTYATGSLLINAIALIVALLLAGQVISNLFFPPAQGRIRRTCIAAGGGAAGQCRRAGASGAGGPRGCGRSTERGRRTARSDH